MSVEVASRAGPAETQQTSVAVWFCPVGSNLGLPLVLFLFAAPSSSFFSAGEPADVLAQRLALLGEGALGDSFSCECEDGRLAVKDMGRPAAPMKISALRMDISEAIAASARWVSIASVE